MKYLFFVAFALLTFSGISQSDPLQADTVIYIVQPDGNFRIIAGQIFPDVNPADKKNFERQRIKRQLDNLAQLENAVREQKKKIQADSAALAADLETVDPNELYAEELAGLIGSWNLTIAGKSDEITVDSTGAFTSKKSGDGTLKVLAEGAKKIEITLADKRIPLQRESEDGFQNEKLLVTMKRIKVEALKR